MSELRYPNETKAYRDARDALLKDEQELIDKMKAVALRRRKLPPGGQLKEDYVFQWAGDGKAEPSDRHGKADDPDSNENRSAQVPALEGFAFLEQPNHDERGPA